MLYLYNKQDGRQTDSEGGCFRRNAGKVRGLEENRPKFQRQAPQDEYGGYVTVMLQTQITY